MDTDPTEMTLNDFDPLIMDPLLTPCNELKRVGGIMFRNCNVLDGHKYICMDNLIATPTKAH